MLMLMEGREGMEVTMATTRSIVIDLNLYSDHYTITTELKVDMELLDIYT